MEVWFGSKLDSIPKALHGASTVFYFSITTRICSDHFTLEPTSNHRTDMSPGNPLPNGRVLHLHAPLEWSSYMYKRKDE
jgi:hypothetical protein